MPKIAKQITDVRARNAKAKGSDYTIASGNGLHLQDPKSGRREWLVRYRAPEGRRGKKILDIYPDMGVADAQKAVQELHWSVRLGNGALGMYVAIKAAKQQHTDEELAAFALEVDKRRHC